MQNSTDRSPGLAQDVTGEHASKAALVLAEVAKTLRKGAGDEPVDPATFLVLVGVRAYDLGGLSCHGGGQNISRRALRAVGELPQGITRRALAERVTQAATELGYDWSQDDNQPVIPKHPVPGPRESQESGRVPAPRREQRAGVSR